MLNSQNFKTITQLRLSTLDIINTVSLTKRIIYIISRSKPQAILISIEEYGKLLDLNRENKALREALQRNCKGES